MLAALAESMWHDGLFSRPIVARMSRVQVEALLATKNGLHHDGASFSVHDLLSVEGGEGEQFDVLIAGERRIRAARVLLEKERILKRDHPSPLARRFRKELRAKQIVVELAEGSWITPDKFLSLQNKENSYHPPSVEETAAGYRSWYDQLKLANPRITIAEFAEKVGRTPETVKGYFTYLDVDPDVRSRLRNASGRGAYSQALEYARLLRLQRGLEERLLGQTEKTPFLAQGARRETREEIHRRFAAFAETLLVEIEVNGYSTRRIRQEVDRWCEEQASPQLSLFASVEGEGDRTLSMMRLIRARAIDARFTFSLRLFQQFVQQTAKRFENGEIGLPTSPFVVGAVVRAVLILHEALLTLIPIIRKHLEHESWSERRRPASLRSLVRAERDLREVDLAPLRERGEEEDEAS